MLTRLRAAGLVRAVATSGPPENLKLVLQEGNLAEFFTATVHGFDIQHGKPAPDCFLLAAERVGLPPMACAVVEDAPVGVRAGVAAGMKVIGLAGTHPPEPLTQAGAACIGSRLAEVTPELVAALLAPDPSAS
jgi:beta-phosphoglucomutase-like phosphatase (HAD superfamily)